MSMQQMKKKYLNLSTKDTSIVHPNEMEEGDFDEGYGCRICGKRNYCRAEFIAPCNCRGRLRWVHRTCLDRSRSENNNLEFSRCPNCSTHYQLICLTNDSNNQKCYRSIRFCVFIMRDIGFIVVVVQLMILFLSLIVSACDVNGQSLAVSFGMADRPLLCYYILGTLIFFAIVGLISTIQVAGSGGNCPVICCDCCSAGANACEFFAMGGEGALVFVLFLVFIFVIIGVCVSVFYGIIIMYGVVRNHIQKLEKRDLVEEYLVKDLAPDARPITLPDFVFPEDLEEAATTANPLHGVEVASVTYTNSREPPMVSAMIMERDDSRPSAPPTPYLSTEQREDLIRRGLL